MTGDQDQHEEVKLDDQEADEEDDGFKIIEGMGKEENDTEGRLLTCILPKFTLIACYTPHSGVGELKRLNYRVEEWDRAFEEHI